MDEDPNTSPCKPTSCLHGINRLWFNLSCFWTGWFFFFDGTSGNIIKAPSPKWLDRNCFCKLFMTSTDVSSFWIASDRTSQGQIEKKKKTWGWEEGPFTSRSFQKGPPFIIWNQKTAVINRLAFIKHTSRNRLAVSFSSAVKKHSLVKQLKLSMKNVTHPDLRENLPVKHLLLCYVGLPGGSV